MQRRLKSRHIMMMALGGAIGAGMFKGSSTSITLAGPSVVLAYGFGGLILLFIMSGLAEMTVARPSAGTFRELIEPLLGPFAGHLVGWMYWLDWVLVMAAETAASATFLQYWFPQFPLWLMSLLVSVALTLLNLFQVSIYGETEYWLAGVKIAVLILFILFGGSLLFTGYGPHVASEFHNLTAAGGFFPHGWKGLAASMLVVMFSFGGTEMVGMTMGETDHPEQVIPRAARSVIVRILIFYVLPILVIVSLVPWNQLGGVNAPSPFVEVFHAIGIPFVGSLMNFVMLTAVLSATNTGMYAASRMLYRQSLAGQAPHWFAHLSKQGVPLSALLMSTVFLYVGVGVAFFAAGNTFNYLMVIPGYSVLVVWMGIGLAHVRSRPQGRWPIFSLFAVAALAVILLGIIVTSPWQGTLISLATVVIVAGGYLLRGRGTRREC
ncbi:amino acid permease [Alicyclobacillaceae bacterium I2511]|nr:amino acid permease [Alicyclobacillaceae bacterium I2511]